MRNSGLLLLLGLCALVAVADAAAGPRRLLGDTTQASDAEAKALEALKAAKSPDEVKALLTKNNNEFLGFPGVRLWAGNNGYWGRGWGRGWGGWYGRGWGVPYSYYPTPYVDYNNPAYAYARPPYQQFYDTYDYGR